MGSKPPPPWTSEIYGLQGVQVPIGARKKKCKPPLGKILDYAPELGYKYVCFT